MKALPGNNPGKLHLVTVLSAVFDASDPEPDPDPDRVDIF
jgi:hypothetical protein